MINHEYLMEMSGGSKEFIKEILEMFLTSYPEYLNTMEKALKNNDSDLFASTTHTFKSMVAVITVDTPYKLAVEIDAIAHSDAWSSANEKLTQLQNSANDLATLIQQSIHDYS